MSVIPFILDGSNKTVVETREEYEKDLIINNQRKSPDFTIQYRGVTYYW